MKYLWFVAVLPFFASAQVLDSKERSRAVNCAAVYYLIDGGNDSQQYSNLLSLIQVSDFTRWSEPSDTFEENEELKETARFISYGDVMNRIGFFEGWAFRAESKPEVIAKTMYPEFECWREF